MDLVWHGTCVVTALKRSIGWMAWLIVATHIYAFAWAGIDDEYYFFFPLIVYDWLDDLVGATSVEATYDVALWSTAIAGTVGLHVLGWIGFSRLTPISVRNEPFWLQCWSRIFRVMGWMSWLLVFTLAILGIVDEIHNAREGKLPNVTGKQSIEFFGGVFCVVSLVHLVAFRIIRFRRQQVRNRF